MRQLLTAITLVLFAIPSICQAQVHRLQLGLYRQEAAAVQGWQALKAEYPHALQGHLPELEQVQTDGGVMLRLTLYMDDAGSAQRLGATLRGKIAGTPERSDTGTQAASSANPVRIRPVSSPRPAPTGGISRASQAAPEAPGLRPGLSSTGTFTTTGAFSSPGSSSSGGGLSLTAGAVPGPTPTITMNREARGYVGVEGDAGLFSITHGVTASKGGDVGPYAGVQFQF